MQLLLKSSRVRCTVGSREGAASEILWKAADVLQNKLTRAQYLDEVTWTTKLELAGAAEAAHLSRSHTAIAEQIVNSLPAARAVECTELSASPSSRESLRRLPWLC